MVSSFLGGTTVRTRFLKYQMPVATGAMLPPYVPACGCGYQLPRYSAKWTDLSFLPHLLLTDENFGKSIRSDWGPFGETKCSVPAPDDQSPRAQIDDTWEVPAGQIGGASPPSFLPGVLLSSFPVHSTGSRLSET